MATAEPLPVSNLKNAKFVASGQTISNADLNVGFRNKLKQTPVSDLSPTAANLIACQTSGTGRNETPKHRLISHLSMPRVDSVLDVMATLIEHDVRALPIFHPPTVCRWSGLRHASQTQLTPVLSRALTRHFATCLT
jgi:hypothetical protein